jgi:mono/diheme cytochrome c family protein
MNEIESPGSRMRRDDVARLGRARAERASSGTRPRVAAEQAQPAPAPPQSSVPVRATNAEPAAPSSRVEEQRAFLNQYCATCHNEKGKAAGLDSARRMTIDRARSRQRRQGSREVGADCPQDARGSDAAARRERARSGTFDAVIDVIREQLDTHREAVHAAARTPSSESNEYANVVRDLLDLQIDPGKYLPSDDSTSGFDNIAARSACRRRSSRRTSRPRRRSAGSAMGYREEPTLVVYRTREDTSQDYHIEGMPFGTRGGMLVPHTFPSTASTR